MRPEDPPVMERLHGGTPVFVSAAHRFGTDAMLLSQFCGVHRDERACDLGTGCGIIPLRWHDAGHRGFCLAVELQAEGIALLRRSLAQMDADAENAPSADGLSTLSDISPTDPDIFSAKAAPSAHIFPLAADLRQLDGTARLPMPVRGGGSAPRPLAGAFDVVCCNPPYFTGGFVSDRPGRAVARHQLTCTTADTARAAALLLRDGGRLCLCQRPAALGQTMADLVNVGIQPKRLRLVRQRPDSTPWLFLLDGRKAGGVGLQLLPDLIVEAPDGGFSDELLEIYHEAPSGGTHRAGKMPPADSAANDAE